MASTLDRITDTDDSGNGTSGTVHNNAWLQALFDAVESGFELTGTYTPTWGNSGTANSLGSGGTITGAYSQVGKLVCFTLTLTWGTGTSSGNGAWTFTLPVTAAGTSQLYGSSIAGVAVDAGTAIYYVASTPYGGTGGIISPATFASPITYLGSTTPHTWASGDTLILNGRYFAA